MENKQRVFLGTVILTSFFVGVVLSAGGGASVVVGPDLIVPSVFNDF